MRLLTLLTMLALSGCGAPGLDGNRTPVVPNDNRQPSGALRNDTLVFSLEARLAAWTPDAAVDTAITVQAFAADDRIPRIPGPLLRVRAGTVVEVRVANHLADSTLVVRGLRPGTAGEDTLHVQPGETRITHFEATTPGTYLYRGRTSGDRLAPSEGRDGPLSGAIVIDAADAEPDAGERIFVLTTLDILPDSSKPEPRDDLFDLAINGLSWPHTEALTYEVGDTVRWRLLNATAQPHPMHLHGFHFTLLAQGDGRTDTTFAVDARRTEVTELMPVGSTARLAWTPTRAGNWLFHCHIVAHIAPFPLRSDSVRAHATHGSSSDAALHARESMSGLVLGVTVRDRGNSLIREADDATRSLRIFAQQSSAPPVEDTAFARGYVLQRGDSTPRSDSIDVPGPVLLLTRGERTAITVINGLPEPTSVHWHGMELESYYDGVAGWSGADARRTPMISPRDSFVAVMTPPRAGTFMYHPHMEEEEQITAGMFGAMIVLEPGERFDAATDLLFLLGDALVDGKRGATVNGARTFSTRQLRIGTTYRLRFLNLNANARAEAVLHADSIPLRWTPLAKDGADLPLALRNAQPARLMRIGVGETYDFLWRPTRAQRVVLEIKVLETDQPFRIPIDVR